MPRNVLQKPPLKTLLARVTRGDASASSELLSAVYDELRGLARHYLAKERKDHTLQPTALVHEAWIRLIGHAEGFESRAHFEAAAAAAMRRILVDHARRRAADKRGSGRRAADVDPNVLADGGDEVTLVDLDELLERLAVLDPRKAKVVELRFFAGMSLEAIATALGVARSTAADDWAVARAWLASRIGGARS